MSDPQRTPDWCALVGSFMGQPQYCGEPAASAWHQPGEWFKHEYVPLSLTPPASASGGIPLIPDTDPTECDHDLMTCNHCGITRYRAGGIPLIDVELLARAIRRYIRGTPGSTIQGIAAEYQRLSESSPAKPSTHAPSLPEGDLLSRSERKRLENGIRRTLAESSPVERCQQDDAGQPCGRLLERDECSIHGRAVWPDSTACCLRNAFEDDAHSRTCPNYGSSPAEEGAE